MAETPRFAVSPTRRGVVAAAGGVGLAAVLAACGDSGSDTSDGAAPTTAAPGTTGTSPAESPSASATGSATTGGGTALAKTSEIPVGGGKIFADQKVVVTQPQAGQFKAFSAVCTHRGCTVSGVSGGTIDCACHGSKFNVADGSVAHGPATTPLPEKQVTVSGDEVTLA